MRQRIGMAARLTPKWTKNSEDAFGESGKIGDSGEVVAYDILTKLGFDVTHYKDDQQRQVDGHDLVINKDNEEHGIDVKTNLFGDRIVYVDYKKIHNSKAIMWFHLNKKTHDWLIYYVSEMLNFIETTGLKPEITNGGLCYKIPRAEIEKW